MTLSLTINPQWGREIFRTHDAFGPIRVFDDGNKRFLAFDSLHEQSCQHKAHPEQLMHEYTCAMLIPLVFQRPRRVTLFGLGGGSLAQCLYHCLPEAQLHVIELRPAVLDIARRFFLLPDDPRLHIEIMDAGTYLPNAPAGSADLLLCDMYHAARMDSQQAQFEFIRDCHRLLSPDGWMTINYSHKSECTPDALAFIASHFADIRVCRVASGNQILVAGKQPVSASPRELTQRARHLNGLLGFPITRYLGRATRIKNGA